jgi:AraC family transcriptional regulator, transcriptional activator of pobA
MIQVHTLAGCPLAGRLFTNNQSNSQFFSAFTVENFRPETGKGATVYARRDFYKIILTTGNATYYYGDRQELLEPGQSALVFTNREVPYRWEVHSGVCEGYSCVFTDDFLPLHTYMRPSDWTVFDTNGQCFFRLTPEQAASFRELFQKMIQEQTSAYPHKYDLLFLYVLECIHGAMKLAPILESPDMSAATRLTEAFRNLLSGQFPIASMTQGRRLRTAQDFADQLAVHVNYLNRTLKAVTGKTTTQLITERVIQEARALLLHTDYTISQISYGLGFEEPTHFSQFFHKHTRITPSSLRQV